LRERGIKEKLHSFQEKYLEIPMSKTPLQTSRIRCFSAGVHSNLEFLSSMDRIWGGRVSLNSPQFCIELYLYAFFFFAEKTLKEVHDPQKVKNHCSGNIFYYKNF